MKRQHCRENRLLQLFTDRLKVGQRPLNPRILVRVQIGDPIFILLSSNSRTSVSETANGGAIPSERTNLYGLIFQQLGKPADYWSMAVRIRLGLPNLEGCQSGLLAFIGNEVAA